MGKRTSWSDIGRGSTRGKPRGAAPYDWAALKQDFVPKIMDSVSKSPF